MQTLGGSNRDWLNESEQLLLGILLVVSLSGDSQSQSEWNTLHTSLPQSNVQFRVQSDISSSHVQSSKLLDLLDGLWGSLFEVNSM